MNYIIGVDFAKNKDYSAFIPFKNGKVIYYVGKSFKAKRFNFFNLFKKIEFNKLGFGRIINRKN